MSLPSKFNWNISKGLVYFRKLIKTFKISKTTVPIDIKFLTAANQT